jgi:hypothetical protein
MTEYYYDIEIGYDSLDIIKKLKAGKKVPFDPHSCKIITIQYQRLDNKGKPAAPLKILKEWETSEEDIVRRLSMLLNPRNVWNFIPVGHNIYFDLGMFMKRARHYRIKYDSWFIYHDLPAIDTKYICIGMNDFQFKDSGLDKFTRKRTDGSLVPVWYHEKEYDKITDYIEKEAEEFIEFYQKLKKALPEFRRRYRFF